MDWEQEQRAPSRAELDREAQEEQWAATYEWRFAVFCHERGLDPDDLTNVLLYEEVWDQEEEWNQ
jgi:hypothetical protein